LIEPFLLLTGFGFVQLEEHNPTFGATIISPWSDVFFGDLENLTGGIFLIDWNIGPSKFLTDVNVIILIVG
jgi:hypothetical protein